jgi:hypothetical protein
MRLAQPCKRFPIEHSFQHVKGHPDDKITYAKLPLDAKLNVDADAEAGKYRYYHLLEPRPRVPTCHPTQPKSIFEGSS